MKTKKALAVLLAVVMLVLPLAVSSFAATENAIVTNPVKTNYNDTEVFNPQGLTISVNGEEITYTPADENFRFMPALGELLSVETTEILVYYNNTIVGSIPVTVEHILGELTAVGNGHGYYCLGCGTLHNFEKHYDYSFGEDPNKFEDGTDDFDYVGEWIPNDDGGIFTMQTTTGICNVCNAEVTRTIPGSEKFLTLFDFENENAMTELESTIIVYFYQIAVSLIQMLVGIS